MSETALNRSFINQVNQKFKEIDDLQMIIDYGKKIKTEGYGEYGGPVFMESVKKVAKERIEKLTTELRQAYNVIYTPAV